VSGGRLDVKTRRRNDLPGRRWRRRRQRPDRRRAVALDRTVGTAVRRLRRRRGCWDGGTLGFGPALLGQRRGGRGVSGAVGAMRAAVGTRTRRGPDRAFMAWSAHGRGRVAATQRRRADEWARRREKEADRWDPGAAIFQIKNDSRTKIAQNK
jgi:hypothetical protein